MINEHKETFQLMLEKELRDILDKICRESIGTELEFMLGSLVTSATEDFNRITKSKYNDLMAHLKKIDPDFTMFQTEYAEIVDNASDKVLYEYIENP